MLKLPGVAYKLMSMEFANPVLKNPSLLPDRAWEVNQKRTATATKTTCKPMIKLQNHSISENDSGQPCQNGNEAPTETMSQRQESKVKNRVLGR